MMAKKLAYTYENFEKLKRSQTISKYRSDMSFAVRLYKGLHPDSCSEEIALEQVSWLVKRMYRDYSEEMNLTYCSFVQRFCKKIGFVLNNKTCKHFDLEKVKG